MAWGPRLSHPPRMLEGPSRAFPGLLTHPPPSRALHSAHSRGQALEIPHNRPWLPAPGLWAGEIQLGYPRDEQPEVSFSEEAVNEVKRQAMSELQKAVSDAERKAHELISTERAKMERALAEARRQASEDALTVVNQQEDSSEVGPPPSPAPSPGRHPGSTTSQPHDLVQPCPGPLDPMWPGELDPVGVPIVQMWKLRPPESGWLIPGHSPGSGGTVVQTQAG